MPRRRRSDSDEDSESNPARRRRQDSYGSDSDGPSAPTSTDAMVKKMVRLALASEYSRLPIRRPDISAKVLGEQGSGSFKTVFEQAQRELRSKFGMEMTELPAREKATVAQRRAAQKTEKASTTKSWIVTSTLPHEYRSAEILIPTKTPSLFAESTYTGIYTFIIALITLNNGSLAEQKLDRYLARTNADVSTPLDRTDKLLQRLCKEGYLVKTREVDGGEEIIEYMLGPRGKVEVGTGAVAGMVRTVYGKEAGPTADMSAFERDELADFEGRLARSLGTKPREIGEPANQVNGHVNEEEAPVARVTPVPQSARRRAPRRPSTHADEEEEEEEDEESDGSEAYDDSE
ncbi:hypothetical protein N7541_001275 [Penicillium brevicompactum]|uniref:MAGE domain-containing protein n=1 Tax=Penicillium brevicompactum TaxID=5074 RepID=A0A9W9RXU1_PENBR|nr:hypothetical protein N7541_001275 [Penicillium brevicompactum]